MALSYPLTPPQSPAPKRMTPRQAAVVGLSESPFTSAQQVYPHEWR